MNPLMQIRFKMGDGPVLRTSNNTIGICRVEPGSHTYSQSSLCIWDEICENPAYESQLIDTPMCQLNTYSGIVCTFETF